MLIDPANASELVNIAQEVGAVAIDGALRYPSETGSWQLGDVDLGEFLTQCRDRRVALIVAPVGPTDLDVILGRARGFLLSAAGRCRAALLQRQSRPHALVDRRQQGFANS